MPYLTARPSLLDGPNASSGQDQQDPEKRLMWISSMMKNVVSHAEKTTNSDLALRIDQAVIDAFRKLPPDQRIKIERAILRENVASYRRNRREKISSIIQSIIE